MKFHEMFRKRILPDTIHEGWDSAVLFGHCSDGEAIGAGPCGPAPALRLPCACPAGQLVGELVERL